MFDTRFFQTVFPEKLRLECEANEGRVPVVEIVLSDGMKLDVCHISFLADQWLALAYFRDPATCADLDTAFLPYNLITRITVSMHPKGKRELGFRVGELQGQEVR